MLRTPAMTSFDRSETLPPPKGRGSSGIPRAQGKGPGGQRGGEGRSWDDTSKRTSPGQQTVHELSRRPQLQGKQGDREATGAVSAGARAPQMSSSCSWATDSGTQEGHKEPSSPGARPSEAQLLLLGVLCSPLGEGQVPGRHSELREERNL